MLCVNPKSLFAHQFNAIWRLSVPSPFVIIYFQPTGDPRYKTQSDAEFQVSKVQLLHNISKWL